jgi:hypothetical protein
MKTTNALVAAALAGVFAAGTTVSHAVTLKNSPVAADTDKEKDKCSGKDGCKGKEKKEEEKTALASVLSYTAEADKEKDKCSGKDGCKGKDKKKEEEKKGEIL